MPILDREPDIHPEDLLESPPNQSWWLVYTLSRREKTLMRQLRQMEIPFYCPLAAQRNRSPAGRVRTSYLPLFSGYLFLNGEEDHRQQALTTNCISRTLPIGETDRLVSDLQQIQRLIATNKPVTHEAKIEPGQLVRVKSGPLRGVEGTVLKRHSSEKLLVLVGFLQQGASIEIDDFQVERM